LWNMVEDSAKKNRADSKKGIPNGNKLSEAVHATLKSDDVTGARAA
jgi:hypothetical protein